MTRFRKNVVVAALGTVTAVAGLAVAGVQPALGTEAAAAPRCHTSDLGAIFTQREGAAGSVYVKVRLTNTSLSTCAIYGYGGLKLVGPDPSRPDVPPTNLLRNLPPGPSLVVLAPGQAADKQLRYSTVPSAGDSPTGPCQVVPVRVLITPPDETSSLTIGWIGGPVCNRGTIDGSAYFRA